ncbi:MAG: FAD-dependent monooxygenase [Alphaproteobacteria bacterium]|nr:FAD-dependent monooxygenase [Alphaproteobacteria bacterium]
MNAVEVPVLIVGAGPVGLLGAHLLGRRGIRTLVAEKHARRLDAPKAHALNPRSLEICAAAGLPMEKIHAAATAKEQGAHVRMMTALAGREIGALPYERQDEAVRELTPWPLINIEQPKFEAILEEAAAAQPNVDLRRGWEWLGCDQAPDAVTSTLRERVTGREIVVRSRYLIAADGANSIVRDRLGIAMEGPAVLQHHLMIHFEADLTSIVGKCPAILYFLFGPGMGVFIAYDIAKTWVLMHPVQPDAAQGEEFTDAKCRDIVRAAVGADIPNLKIKGAGGWAMSAQVADRYRVGNVFLAGDAAHRFPPTGGLGLNTGVADIDNLAWKIAAVGKGWAGPGILDSYEPERRAVAQTNMSQSLTNAMRMFALFEALGCMPGQPVDIAAFNARLDDPIAREKIDAAVAYQKDHFDSLRLQLGYAYGDALKSDADLPVSAFTPKAVAGARLPHVAIDGNRSTLDLLDHDSFTLITGKDAAAWKTLRTLASLKVVSDGIEFAATGWTSRMGLTDSGALLVRPDGHILCVANSVADTGAITRALVDYTKPANVTERIG